VKPHVVLPFRRGARERAEGGVRLRGRDRLVRVYRDIHGTECLSGPVPATGGAVGDVLPDMHGFVACTNRYDARVRP
jgi:hypothetical protein